jgi:hypothetical protein
VERQYDHAEQGKEGSFAVMCERKKYCAHLTLIKKKYVALRIMRAPFHRKLDFASQNERKARCILTRALGGLCRSGSFARVKMMQATDFWDLDHLAKRGRLDSSADRNRKISTS